LSVVISKMCNYVSYIKNGYLTNMEILNVLADQFITRTE